VTVSSYGEMIDGVGTLQDAVAVSILVERSKRIGPLKSGPASSELLLLVSNQFASHVIWPKSEAPLFLAAGIVFPPVPGMTVTL